MIKPVVKLQDAACNGYFVLEMLRQVQSLLNDSDNPDKSELCKIVLAGHGVKFAMDILERECLMNINMATAGLNLGVAPC